MKEQTCPNCNGNRTIEVEERHYDAYGRGYNVIMTYTCPQCNGYGTVYVEEYRR
jgi:DnaJ-class molecular chaperone